MKQYYSSKTLILINIIIVLYFGTMYLIKLFAFDFVLAGVLTNLLTIPFLIAEPIFLFLGISLLHKRQEKSFFLIVSLILLLASFILSYGSLFIK